MNKTIRLVIAVIVSQLAGIIGSVFTAPSIDGWYAEIVKPTWNPPAWVFGPVWITLYFLMGVSLWLIWNSHSVGKKKALGLFGIQLVLNSIWSPIFFGLHSIGSALIVLIFLWFAVVATLLMFRRISKLAAWLLVPYLCWVSFALYLNYSIYALN